MRNVIYRFVVLSGLLVSPLVTTAQSLRIGEIESRESELKRTIAVDTATFYTLSREWTSIRSFFTLKQYVNLELQHRTALPQNVDGVSVDYKDIARINDTLSVFFCLLKNGEYYYYLQQYDNLCSVIGEPKLLAVFPRMSNKKWSNGNVIFSPDCSRYLIYLEGEDKKDNRRSMQYVLFSANHGIVRQGSLESVKEVADVHFNDVWLFDSDVIVFSEYNLLERPWHERKSNRRMDMVNLHVLRPGNDVMLTLVPPQNEYLTQIECVLNADNTLSGMGIYCERDDHFHGLFTFSTSVECSREVAVKTKERRKSIELSALDLKYKDRKPEKPITARNRSYTCNEMKLRGVFSVADSTVFVWERCYFLVNKSTTSYGSKDLLFVKTHMDSIINITTVPKSRYSFNDGGVNLPTLVMRTSEKELVCYFNDSPDHYNESGVYTEAEKSLLRQSDESSIIALEYNLQTNTYQRNQLFDPTVFDLPAAPLSWSQVQSDYLLMYFTSFTKTRYALWKFR